MSKTNENEKETYFGETGQDGQPHGRGTIVFQDGRRYSGSIDGAAQTGRGIYRYTDGSSFRGGFTVNAEDPAWCFTYPYGREIYGFVSHFSADEEEIQRGEFNEIDEICEVIVRTTRELGIAVEYNARTILADALYRRGKTDIEGAVRRAAVGCVEMLTVPYVIRYIYG